MATADDQPKPSKSEARAARRAKKLTKQTARAHEPSTIKTPIPGPPVIQDPEALMVFRLGVMDEGGRWGFDGLSSAHVKLLAESCKSWETLTVTEFRRLPSHVVIPIEDLIKDAQERLVDIGLDHFDGLWHLRLGNKPRLWGLLDGNVFYLVWWDPDHEICPSAKKHT